MNGDRGYLFHDSDLGAVLSNQTEKMTAEIEGMDSNALLNANVEDLSSALAEKYQVAMIKLKEDETTVEHSEASIDVSHDPYRVIFDRDEPFYVKGTRVSFFVPFEGDPGLFKCQPSTYTMNPPRASLVNNDLIFRYDRTDHDAAAIKSSFQTELGRVRQYLEWMSGNVSQFNDSLRECAKGRIEQRRSKLLKDKGLVSALGFPLRRREGMPQTYNVPTVRRKPAIQKSSNPVPPFKPEPAIDMQEYDHILSVISNMVVVMERSPKALSGMGEEDLRQHFLVQLNGHYEGQATGETFNFEGKTDILIRVDGKNIFIAECKFWRGPESFTQALDQLLGYATWRDSKIALLIFNRDRQLSTVLSKIPELVKASPQFKRQLEYKSDTGFRFAIRHRDDQQRELVLTVIVFEVPA
jgi:hypothetical protein